MSAEVAARWVCCCHVSTGEGATGLYKCPEYPGVTKCVVTPNAMPGRWGKSVVTYYVGDFETPILDKAIRAARVIGDE